MCTRFVLLEQHYREILQQLGITGAAAFHSRYNIAPGTDLPVARPKPESRQREVAALRWGLVPAWAKSSDGARLMNARAETVATKPSFRGAFKARRGLVPATGFYEFQKAGRARKPWLFRWRDERPFGFAALWENWRAPDGSVLSTCAIITTAPNELMQPIHNRMPVMLTPDQFDAWLDPDVTAPEKLAPLLRPPPAAAMRAVALDTRVNSIRHDDPDCWKPAAEANAGPQLSLEL